MGEYVVAGLTSTTTPSLLVSGLGVVVRPVWIQLCQQDADRLGGVGGRHHSTDHGSTGCADRGKEGGALRRNPPDCDHRGFDRCNDTAESLDADDLACVALGGCRPHRSAAEIIGTLRRSRSRRIGIVCRESNEKIVWHNGSDGGHGKICGTQVDTICSNRQREIEAVIDEEKRIKSSGEVSQSSGEGEELPSS